MLKDFRNEEFDIVIQAGQSNSEGCGLGSVEKPYEQSDSIYMMESNFTVMIAREKIWGNNVVGNFVLPFAERYIKNGYLKEGRKLLILLAAVGGTGFCDHRWGMEDDLYLQMIKMINTATNLNAGNQVKAFLWHQGETDVNEPDQDRHYNNLKRLVLSVRQLTGRHNLPFIAGDFVESWKVARGLTDCKSIIDAIRRVCSDIGHAGFVETAGLQSNDEALGNGDDVHFCREALYTLGEGYFKAWQGIIKDN